VRIVGGRFRGHALKGPAGPGIRPTSDRLRESLFNVLMHAHGDPVTSARVLDLFAGTGALGLEAMSRSAAHALFVDDGVEARGLIRSNIEALGLLGATKLFKRDATRLGPVGTTAPFDLAFCDPPYGKGLAERALEAARDGGWFAPGAIVVVEEAANAGFAAPLGFETLETRDQGETSVAFLRFS
jgi:16S rRNA (guanine966-N2)-methyltransferase